METDNEEFNRLCWESLKGRYEKKLEEDNDDEVVKNFKKAIKASDEYKRREAIGLFACAVVFVVFSLGLVFTKETESIIYKIIMVVEGGLFLIMLVFAATLSHRAKQESSKVTNMKEMIRDANKRYWFEALNELADANETTGEYAFMEILAKTEIKSIYFKQNKLVELLLFVGEMCFLPGLGSILKPQMVISDAIGFVFSLVYVILANVCANYIGSKMDELTTINYRYSEMNRLVLEEYCKDR